MFRTMPLSCFVGIIAMTAAHAAAPWITSEQYGALEIVLAPDAPPLVQQAAEEFQYYWKASTGCEIPVLPKSGNGIPVWLGRTGTPPALLNEARVESLAPDGVAIRTFKAARGAAPQIVIVGGSPQGTLFAVYEFFEQYLGVRWFTPFETYIPKAPEALANIKHVFNPPFTWRDTTYFCLWGELRDQAPLQTFRRVHRLNSGPSFSCHSFFRQVPPTEHGASHPEYYSFYDGKRHVPSPENIYLGPGRMPREQETQLCLTNPDVQELLYQAACAELKANPANNVVHISQMDWAAYCQCDQCKAVDDREGSPMGSVLTCLNRVAERLDETYPGSWLETLAYTYTRTPPKYVKPADNLIIKLCSIECDFGKPLEDRRSEPNRAFVRDIKRWARVSKRLNIWDYTPNYTHPQMPHPNLHVLKPNMLFFLKNGVMGMFEQGFEVRQCEFEELRAYMIMRLLWNPRADDRAIRDEFIDYFYGNASSHVKAYIDLMADHVLKGKQPMPCFDDGRWMDYDLIVEAELILRKALAAADSGKVYERIDRLYLSLELASLACPPKIVMTDKSITMDRPCLTTYETLIQRAKKLGLKQTNQDYDNEQEYYRLLQGQTPPRHVESELVKLATPTQALWIVPQLHGTVLRWQEKKADLELLQGYQQYELGFGFWQEWASTPGVHEYPLIDAFAVTDLTATSITLVGQTAAGLAVTKQIALTDDESVSFRMTLTNPGIAPVPANIKMHPEFYQQGAYEAEFWAERDSGKWEHLNPYVDTETGTWGRILEAKGFSRLAFYVRKKDFGIITDINTEQVHSFICFWTSTPTRQHTNLELVPPDTPLAPGESRTIEGRYRLFHGEPASL